MVIRIYKDILNRIISVLKDTKTGKYTLNVTDGYTFLSVSTTFPDRKSCLNALKRYPRKRGDYGSI